MSRRRNSRKVNRKVDEDISPELLKESCCFICDRPVKKNGVQIVLGRTPYSNVGLPAKIGQLIGDKFMVVVGEADIMCARCSSLISHLDKLETDAQTVKQTLTSFIASKYQLNHNACYFIHVFLEICAKMDDSKSYCDSMSGQPGETDHNSSDLCSVQVMGTNNKRKSDLVSLLSCKRKKSLSTNCENCNFCSEDKDALQIHSALCLNRSNRCSDCGVILTDIETKSTGRFAFLGTCNVCTTNFDDEGNLSRHMALHTKHFNTCNACNYTSLKDDILLKHLFTHCEQIYQCSLCKASFNQKAKLDSHLIKHLIQDKCLDCSIAASSQAKLLSEGELALACLGEETQSNRNHIDLKENIDSQYMESLIRVDSFDSDGSNIEFHSCPNCGLTFLNKLLFTEHMKMHNKNGDDISEAHDVLKSSTVSVNGDCSIDDDLEDLFEKLHAETSSSVQDIPEKSCCVSDHTPSMPSSMHNSSGTLECGTPICGSDNIESRNDMPDVSSKLIAKKDSPVLDQNLLSSSLGSLGFTSFETSPIVKEKNDNSQITNLLGSAEQQSYIFISNTLDGLSDCQSQNGVVLHNATIDPNNGSIQLIPFVINDSVDSTQQGGGILESDPSNLNEDKIFEQNFCKMKPEPELALNKLEEGNSEMCVLSCDHCNFQTSIELVLKRHMKVHQENLVQKCSICNRVFSSTQRLLTHIDLRHKNAGPLDCPSCSQELNNSLLLREHLAQEHSVGKRTFSCPFCAQMFPTRKSCRSHEESHSEIFKFSCKICLKKFSSEDDLNDHVKWDHDTSGQCRYCGKKIDKPKALKHHELRHTQESNHHQCQECKRIFKTKTGLRHHAASHTGQFKYCCDFCGRGFMSRMMLEEHRSCHTKEERYVCDVCGQKFTFQSTYWIHRKWHENPYPYKCSFCGRFFKHSSLLAVHKRKHTGERPYKCSHCPLTFPVSGTLKRHMILHTGIYPFNCNSCKRGFTARHKYTSHLEKVHGAKDLENKESSENDLKLGISGKEISNGLKEWEFDAESYQTLDMVESPGVRSRDPLISDQIMQSRVVEIVLDESYQPVATVTLGGGGETIIPEIWYD
ncbi:Zinc finger protein 675 [Frankliniella fusca]|uniref:Zinc finger protein 675 n=1 Tax=Frankliniella fusca TaxID=407009 RepID=A0AAE1HTR5_9NEOP|nr:Zinc finger protein 675 [Frankliniella fusca]